MEDNRDAAESLREALELVGHSVQVASDGLEGLELARRLKPDVILCDIGLPKMDGYQVARTLRGEPAFRNVLLVAVTGYALPEDQRRALEAGFDHHLAKPVELEILERLIALDRDGA